MNNHPLKSIKVTGKIVGEQYKEFAESKKAFVKVTIDDFSGTDSIITTLVSQSTYINGGLTVCNSYGKEVTVTGTVRVYRNVREIQCESIICVGVNQNLLPQLNHWKSCLTLREELLANAWVFNLFGAGEDTEEVAPFLLDSRKDLFGTEDSLPIVLDSTDDESADSILALDVKEHDSVLDEPSAILHEDVVYISDSEPEEEYSNSSYFQNPTEAHLQAKELEITQVKLVSTPVITEFQITVEIIKLLISKKGETMKLLEIYQNGRIASLLYDLAISKAPLRSSKNQQDFLAIKHETFHFIRHNLQTSLGLITTTKSQTVKSHNLWKICNHIIGCLDAIRNSGGVKVFDVENYLRIFKSSYPDVIGTGMTSKHLNAIIDLLLEGEESFWRYDSRRMEWKYIH
ncbi:hypothetical protein PSN45_005285 [Yamadazyma tenuis]|nr:hypothetical protein PSN45_005285 [Yamadazyma tenuis]